MSVFAFLYNSNCHESSARTISLHKTKAGAYKAMRKHRVAECVDRRERKIEFGRGRLYGREYQYDDFCWWGIEEMKVA